jgi:acid phosphatase family membrane protein YuiD
MEYQILLAAFLGWFFAQILKVIIPMLRFRQINFKRFVESGGMPSSHTSMAVALCCSIAKYEGFNSTYFAIAAVFTSIVMYDASGVRRAAGRQAAIINQIIKDIYHHKYKGSLLKELIGHTPLEVWAGFLLGVIVGLSV